MRRLDDPQVRRHHPTRLQDDQIAGNQFGSGNGARDPVPQDRRRGRGHLFEGLHRLFGTVLLDETDDRIDHHDDENGDRIDQIADEPGQDGGSDENQDQDVLELGEEHQEG